MILANMVLQRLGRYKGRILAGRESASEPANVGHFVLQMKLLGLKAQCGPGARAESTCEC